MKRIGKRSRDFTHSLILMRFSSTLQLLLSIECCIRDKEILLHSVAKNYFLRTILSNTRFYKVVECLEFLKVISAKFWKKKQPAHILVQIDQNCWHYFAMFAKCGYSI
ncbi:hypothetical protein T4C_10653 [Trichinella pseudospiralis]|uniref:Uncharacterized protein n=1 Tax=Trichinella pseudospiralis TaxID=6337 RepID=A0A0V1JT14_TRIPS|nr:hypothetical protein T4C_10653 [Trichinella pseudospiralis]